MGACVPVRGGGAVAAAAARSCCIVDVLAAAAAAVARRGCHGNGYASAAVATDRRIN